MSQTDQGFVLVDLPPISRPIRDVYEDCPETERGGGRIRHLRSARIRMSWTADDDWFFAPVGEETPSDLSRAADTRRVTCLTPLLRRGLSLLRLDLSADWSIDLRQIRTVVTTGPARQAGPPATMTGYRAGEHEYLMVAMLRRHRLAGGAALLSRPGETTPFHAQPIGEGQALLVEGRSVGCALLEPYAAGAAPGMQDVLICALSRWPSRLRSASSLVGARAG